MKLVKKYNKIVKKYLDIFSFLYDVSVEPVREIDGIFQISDIYVNFSDLKKPLDL